MILYHGSTDIVTNPQILKSDIGRDFGFGFYTTDIKIQAQRWAERKAKILKKRNIEAFAVLNIYEIDFEIAKDALNINKFEGASMEWLEFVVTCRANSDFKHDYDVVRGNIADDNVGETVSYVMSGIMRKEDAVKRLKFEEINNQICFNSDKALLHLKFVKSEVVGGR